jgi:hypothetical protein
LTQRLPPGESISCGGLHRQTRGSPIRFSEFGISTMTKSRWFHLRRWGPLFLNLKFLRKADDQFRSMGPKILQTSWVSKSCCACRSLVRRNRGRCATVVLHWWHEAPKGHGERAPPSRAGPVAERIESEVSESGTIVDTTTSAAPRLSGAGVGRKSEPRAGQVAA